MSPQTDVAEIHTFDAIIARARQKAGVRKPRAALVVPSQLQTLQAFLKAAADSLIEPIAIGDEALLKRKAGEAGLDLAGLATIDLNQPDLAVLAAAKMAQRCEIDLIVQGRIAANQLVDLLASEAADFLPEGRVMSHVGVIQPQRYHKLLFVTDGMVHAAPDLRTKLAIAENLAMFGRRLGLPDLRTAVVAAVEAISPQMPATLDGAVMAKMSARGQIKGLVVDGPLSLDIAVDPSAAAAKGINDSPVAGQADAVLASTRLVASGICQAMSLFGHSRLGGVLVGGCAPVAVNFGADSVEARYNSIALAVLAA